jgi:hypothetical protein
VTTTESQVPIGPLGGMRCLRRFHQTAHSTSPATLQLPVKRGVLTGRIRREARDWTRGPSPLSHPHRRCPNGCRWKRKHVSTGIGDPAHNGCPGPARVWRRRSRRIAGSSSTTGCAGTASFATVGPGSASPGRGASCPAGLSTRRDIAGAWRTVMVRDARAAGGHRLAMPGHRTESRPLDPPHLRGST